MVDLNFTDKGTKAFADFTRAHIGQTTAFVLDNRVIELVNINDAISLPKQYPCFEPVIYIESPHADWSRTAGRPCQTVLLWWKFG